MSANSSIILTELDFANLKESLKASMKSQGFLRDYDFDGSVMNVLLDVLSHNSYLNTYYLNMIASEMWMDSAQLRDSVVSHAKELNYIPRSFISSEAIIKVTLTGSDENQATIVIPKGSVFVGRNGPESFNFTTDKNTLAYRVDGVYVADQVSIFEGLYVSESFVIDHGLDTQSFKISNPNIDLRSLTVTVIEDNGGTAIEYLRGTSLFGISETSKVYFVQPGTSESYEIVFGDGVSGRRPKDNSVVLIEYRTSKGELPNGINNFSLASTLIGANGSSIETIQSAAGGSISESAGSIKFNAPRAFTTQERAVTAEDYENLLRMTFPEVNVVSAYGGEEADPPQYGKVILSIDIDGFDGLPKSKEDTYRRFLKERAPLSIDPVFVQPDFVYLAVDTLVRYNINLTGLTASDISTLVVSSILDYRNTELDDFKVTGRYSRLISAVDGSHASIISNETQILASKRIKPRLNKTVLYDVSFYQPLIQPMMPIGETVSDFKAGTLYSNAFQSSGKTCYLADDGIGNIRMVSVNDQGKFVKIRNVGSVDYETGKVQIFSLMITKILDSDVLKLYARTRLKDISSTKNVILTIDEADINVRVEQIRE